MTYKLSNIKIALKQHIGEAAAPIVSIGDTVKKGQLLAVCKGLGANIHSSVYGSIVRIDNTYVTIKPDAQQPEDFVKIKETSSHLEAIKEAGIVGAGGAGFPAHVKYNIDLDGGCVIVNAVECEPTLLHNIRVLEEDAESIVKGLIYIMEITNATKSYIAIKPKNKGALIATAKAIQDYNKDCISKGYINTNREYASNVEIKFLPDMYPSGDERVVIRELLGEHLEPGQLPSTVGAIVSNVETVKRVREAIDLRKPVITKDITVGGRLVNTFGNNSQIFLDQPIGTPVAEYINKCGGYIEPFGEIVLGGPFTGQRGYEDSVLTKTTSGIFVTMPFPRDEKNFGILACECGASKERLREIVADIGGTVVSEMLCKRMVEVNGRYRCEEPGKCPGQAEAALYLKRNGAEAIISSACEE